MACYPLLTPDLSKDQLADHFTLTVGDRQFLSELRKNSHRLGCAILLKTTQFLGYAPKAKKTVPSAVVISIANQLALRPELFLPYRWRGRTWRHHLSLIRAHMGTRAFASSDVTTLVDWLAQRGNEFPSRKELLGAAVQRCVSCRLELPKERDLYRMVGAARRRFFHALYEEVFARVSPEARERMQACIAPLASGPETYDWMKAAPGKLGIKTILEEIRKLEYIRSFQIDGRRHFPGTSLKILRQLRERARAEDASEIRRHRPAVRVTLLAALLNWRQKEITDGVVRVLLELVRRIDKKTDKELEKQLVRDIKQVFGKTRILYRIAAATTANPDATVRAAVFPVVGEDVLRRLVEESKQQETSYEVVYSNVAQRKYRAHYRQMVKPVLDALTFQCDNPAQLPLLDGMALMHRYLDTKHTHYPETEKIPEEMLTGKQREVVFEKNAEGKDRVAKHPFELVVLRKLEKALKCKELWVEGAYRFRNPDEDLPPAWPQTRVEHYRRHEFPVEASTFLAPIRAELNQALEDFHRFLGRSDKDVYVRHPGGGEQGEFHVPKLPKQKEPSLLDEIHGRVLQQYGIVDLLDILVEADRQVQFSRFFRTSAQRHVLSQQEIQRRLLLTLFGLGTNMGLSRVHSAAKPSCSYDDLRYFRSRFVTVDALREANIALVNRILEVRNPEIWGQGTTCASDAKHINAWDQNLMTERNPHYPERGVMVYWHVETNATCVYSHVHTISSSQVAAMIRGLVQHDTDMRLETNYVDSHGQSEVAFAFCRFFCVELLPRLKRLKHEKLYLPDKESVERLPRFAGILARPAQPIRWDLIEQQYDEMVRHVVAVLDGTGPIESILRRFNSYNRTHPTYKAFAELGKVDKTIFLCHVLSQPPLRQEIQEGLNVVENWNSCNDFICFGRRSELQTNDPDTQELVILSLHLLQNSLVLANTVMLERVLATEGLFARMAAEDRRALTPLFTRNVNPYGDFNLDVDKPSFLEAA
jgi:TnpA family transposase